MAFSGFCSNQHFSKTDLTSWASGIVQERPAFATPEEERQAEEKLDRFMADVLIPLAAQTNALVFCSATLQTCVLSASLTRIFNVQRAKWAAQRSR